MRALRRDERVGVNRSRSVERSRALAVFVKSRRAFGRALRNDRFGFRIGEQRRRLLR
jgi:hypothetical protein